jgi:hypothetical protein
MPHIDKRLKRWKKPETLEGKEKEVWQKDTKERIAELREQIANDESALANYPAEAPPEGDPPPVAPEVKEPPQPVALDSCDSARAVPGDRREPAKERKPPSEVRRDPSPIEPDYNGYVIQQPRILNNRYVFVVREKIKGAARHTIRTKIEPKAGGQKQIQKALQYAKAQIDRWVGSKGLKPAGFIDSFKEFVATNPNTNENSKRQLEYAAGYYQRFFKKKLVHEISHKDILDFINVIQAESLRNNEVRKDGSERGKQKRSRDANPEPSIGISGLSRCSLASMPCLTNYARKTLRSTSNSWM